MIWNQSRKSNGDEFNAVSQGGDGIYVAGRINSTASLLKFDQYGNQVWTRQFGSRGDVRAAFVAAENVYLAGVSSPLTNQSFTGPVLYVRDYDSNGNIVWTSEFSNSTGDSVTGLYADSSAVYILTAHSLLKYNLGGDKLWTLTQGGDEISGDGSSVYVTNSSLITRLSVPAGFLTSYRPNGSVAWSVRFDPPDHSGYYRSFVSADSSGAYWYVESDRFGYLIMSSTQGAQEWNFRDPSAGSPTSLTISSSGLIIGGAVSAPYAYTLAILQEFEKAGSLIFFGLNPPWSFVAVGAIGTVLIAGVVWYVRHRNRLARLGIMRAEPLLPSHIPADVASA